MSEVLEKGKKTVSSQSRRQPTRTLLGEPDDATIAQLAAAAIRHLSVDRIVAACGSSAALDIDKVELSDTSVDSVLIEELTTKVACGSAVLHNVRAILELNFTAHWEYDLKWLGSDSGVKVLGSKANTIELHDITLPMLQDFEFTIPSVEVSDVDAQIEPITQLELGGSTFEGLSVTDSDAPRDGFSVSGLDIGTLEITNIAVPGTRTSSLAIDSFSPNAPLTIPGISLGNVDIPAIDIDDVSSEGAVSVMGATLESIQAPIFKLGSVFKVKLVVDPVLHLQIGELVLADLKASASLGSVSVKDVRSEVAVSGLSMRELELDDAKVDTAELV